MEVININDIRQLSIDEFVGNFADKLDAPKGFGDAILYTDNSYILYDVITNAINLYNKTKKTKVIFVLAKKNSFCDFSKDPKNIIGEQQPVIFYTISNGVLNEISSNKLEKEQYVVFFEDANLYTRKLLSNIVKFGVGNEILRLIHLRTNINIPDASARNTVRHIAIK